MKNLKKHLPLLLLAASFIFLHAGCGGGQKGTKDPDRVIIKVGDRSVTAGEFEQTLKRLLPEGTAGMDEQEIKDLKKDLAHRLVEEELVLGEAARLGITVTDGELTAEEDKIKEASGNPAIAGELASRYGNIDVWRAELKRALLIRKVVENALGTQINIKNEEARKFYREHIKDYDRPEQVHASMIVVSSEEEARKIKDGLTPENFASVAEEKSLSPEGERGGDLGFFSRGDMPEEFGKTVFRLKPGEISGIVKTEYGYHIFLLKERTRGRRLSFNEVKDDIVKKLRGAEKEKRYNSWMAALKKTTHIEVREGLL